MKFILGKKIKTTQIFDEKGNLVPVTLIEAGPCVVTQIKTKDKDGYEAIQIGFIKKEKNIKKTEKGKEFKYLKEEKIKDSKDLSKYKPGDVIDVSIFKEGDKLKISGISKGKGFQGGVKRWGFAGKSSSHGVKHEHRTIGSIGGRYPQRVIKGRKMPGRTGGERVTVRNIKIVKVDKDNNLIAIKGAVPGSNGSLLEIRG
jgi:large subunit ribosomal protein L3